MTGSRRGCEARFEERDSIRQPPEPNTLELWRKVGVGLAGVGLVDGVYLLSESLDSKIPIYCPSKGVIDCGPLLSSSYSKIGGVPVALLGTLFFASMLAIFLLNNETLNYLLLPLWASGVAFAAYLIFIEVFVVHAICPYCTVAHVIAVLLGAPAIKVVLSEER